MFLHVDPANGLAIYDQILRQIKFAVAGGVLTAGEFVPSVRELARELAVNPNTVAKAYQLLQSEGVLEPVRGTGLAVAAGAAKRCGGERIKLLRQRLRHVLVEAKKSHIDLGELRDLLEEEWKAMEKA